MRTEIKEKIEKLLSLATSPNENEAKAALLKARELMAKHKLTEADFEDVKAPEMVHEMCDVAWTTDSGEIWLTDLCKLIADNFCCLAAWQTYKGTRTHTLQITGLDKDVEICKPAVEYAAGFVRGNIKALQRRYFREDGKTIASSYAKGFIMGMEMAFEEQQEEHPEWGLVIVKPEEVQKYEDTLGNRSVRTRKTGFNNTAYTRGVNDGMKFNTQRVLE